MTTETNRSQPSARTAQNGEAVGRPDQEGTGAVLARGAAVNIATLLVANLRGVFTFLIARLIGSAALGTFGMAWAVMDIVSRIGVFGLDIGAMTRVARHEAKDERRASRALFGYAITWGLLISAAVSLVAIVITLTFGGAVATAPDLVVATAVMLLALPGMALYRIGTGVSRGLKVMRHDFYSHGLAETFVTLGVFLGALAFGFRDRVPEIAAVLGVTAAGTVAAVLARGVLGRPPPGEARSSSAGLRRELFRHSAPISGYMLLNVLINRLDVFLLGVFVGRAPGLTLEVFGVYCAAVEVAGGMRKVKFAFDPIFAPVVAGHRARQDHGALSESASQVGRWLVAAQLPIFGLLLVAASLVMSIFGPDFRAGALWLVLLAVAHGVTGFAGLAESVIVADRPHLNLVNSAVVTVLYVAASLILIAKFGATGAAAASIFAASCLAGLRYTELRFLMRWTWPWVSLVRPLVAFVSALTPALIVRVLIASWPGELIAGVVLLLGYVLAWRIIGLDPRDRATLNSLRRRTATHAGPEVTP